MWNWSLQPSVCLYQSGSGNTGKSYILYFVFQRQKVNKHNTIGMFWNHNMSHSCWQQSVRDSSVTTASLKDFIVLEADWGRWKCSGVALSFCPLSDLYSRKNALRSSCLSSEECVVVTHRWIVSSVVLLFVTRDCTGNYPCSLWLSLSLFSTHGEVLQRLLR